MPTRRKQSNFYVVETPTSGTLGGIDRSKWIAARFLESNSKPLTKEDLDRAIELAEKRAGQPTLEFVSNDEYNRRLAASKPKE